MLDMNLPVYDQNVIIKVYSFYEARMIIMKEKYQYPLRMVTREVSGVPQLPR